MNTNFQNPVAVNHRGKSIYFVSQSMPADQGDKIFYNVLNLDIGTENIDDRWAGYTELSFPPEVSLAGMNILRVQKPVVNKGFFQVLSDEQYVYVVRGSSDALYVNRYILVEVPNSQLSGDTKSELQPAWEVRFQGSQKPDTPQGEKDSQSFINFDGVPFLEPVYELGFGSSEKKLNYTDGFFAACFLPTDVPDKLRWQFFVVNVEDNRLYAFSADRTEEGWFEFSVDQIDFANAVINPDTVMAFRFSELALTTIGPPAIAVYTKQEPVETSDSTVLKLQQAYRLMLTLQLKSESETLLGTLDMAISRVGMLSYPAGQSITLGAVQPAPYTAGFSGNAFVKIQGDPIKLADQFTQQIWIHPTASDVVDRLIVGSLDKEIVGNNRPPSIWITERNKIGVGFGDGTQFLQLKTIENVLSTNAWNNLIVTFSEGKYELHVNGAIADLEGDDFTGKVPANASLDGIGGKSLDGFQGNMAELRIWNSVETDLAKKYLYERIPSEVAKEMESLDLYYRLDAGDGTTIPNIANNQTRSGLVLGVQWIAASSPLKSESSAVSHIDAQGLISYAGAIVPATSGAFKEFGSVKNGSRPYLLSSADGFLHLYYQGENDSFLAAQYDTSNSRAHFAIVWQAKSQDPTNHQAGSIFFSSRQTGTAFNHSQVSVTVDAVTDLMEVVLDDTQGGHETWRGLPPTVDYVAQVLSGLSLNDPADPRLLTGERVYFDYSKTRPQSFHRVGDPLQYGYLQFVSRNIDSFVFKGLTVTVDGGRNVCSVSMTVDLDRSPSSKSFSKTMKNVPTDVAAFVETLNGGSTTYDYKSSENTEPNGALFYYVSGNTQNILVVISVPAVKAMKFDVTDSMTMTDPENPLCDVTISLEFKDASKNIEAKWLGLSRISDAFLSGIKGGTEPEQKAVAAYLNFLDKSKTAVVKNGSARAASLYAVCSFIDVFGYNLNGKLEDFTVELQPIQGVETTGAAGSFRQGSLLFGVYSSQAPDNGFPAAVYKSQMADLVQPGVDGGWIADSPQFSVRIGERTAVALTLDAVLNKPIDIDGAMTIEAWSKVLPLEKSGLAQDVTFPRIIHANFGPQAEAAKYMLGTTYSASLQFLKSFERGPAAVQVSGSREPDKKLWIFGTTTSSTSIYIKANLKTVGIETGTIFEIAPNEAGFARHTLLVSNSDGTLTYHVSSDGGSASQNVLSTKLPDQVWTMLTFTRQGDTIRAYVNDKKDIAFNVPAYPSSPASNTLTIGANTFPFEFEANQCAVWNRTLSEADVVSRYQLALPEDDQGLVLLLRMDTYNRDALVENHALLTGASYNTTVTGFFSWQYPGVFCMAFAAVREKAVITRGALLSTNAWNHLAAQYDVHYGIRLEAQAFGDCGNEDDLNMDTSISLEAWIKQESQSNGASQTIFSKFGRNTQDQCYEFGINGDFQPYLKLRLAGMTTSAGLAVPETSMYTTVAGTKTLDLNKAYHVAASAWITSEFKTVKVNDKDKNMNVYTLHCQIYVDGKPAGPVFLSPDMYGNVTINKSQTKANIGRTKPQEDANAQQYFNGKLSDIRLWNTALKDEDILANYGSTSDEIKGEGLVSAWYFSEQQGRTAFDSESENNALLTNRELWATFHESSSLGLILNGRTVSTRDASVAQFGGYEKLQMQFGGMLNLNGAYIDTLRGNLDEIRIWSEVRTLAQINDNKERFLTGKESKLEGYWRFQDGSGRVVTDETGKGNDGYFTGLPETAAPVWDTSEAPISNEAGIVLNTLRGRQTKFNQRIKAGPAVVEFADSQFNFRKELFSIYKRCYIYIDQDGIVQRENNFKIGDLSRIYLGQVQSKPSLIGYIEGAPPLPSENLTLPYYNSTTGYLKYDGIAKVQLNEADDTTVSFSSSKTSGSHLAFDIQGGLAIGASADAGAFVFGKVAKAESTIGVAVGVNWSTTRTDESGTAYGISKNTANQLGNTGEWEPPDSAWAKENDERRYLPFNKGYALVQSMTADMYALYLQSTGAMVGFIVVPNLDIPPDKNIIHFPINPKYVKNGTLDGKVGLQNDPDYPQANLERGSYFKPVEAYSLKRKVEKKEQRLLAYYTQFNAVSMGQSQTDDLTEFVEQNPIYDFDEGRPRIDLINNYVWTASGGMYSEKESGSSVRQETHSGSYSFKWATGLKAKGKFMFGATAIFGFYLETSLMGGTQWTVNVKKAKNETNKFGLDVTANPEGFLNKYIGEDGRLYSEQDVPGKVDAYRFMSYYLSPDEDNFNTFFDESMPVVDPAWYKLSGDPMAAALKEAEANPNPCWRILHRVTYVSRVPPEFQSFPLDTNAPKETKPANLVSNMFLIPMVAKHLNNKRKPPANEVGNAVRNVIQEDLVKTIPWWSAFLDSAKVANSPENITLGEFITDTINYMVGYFDTLDD